MSEITIIQASSRELEEAITKRFQIEIEKLKNHFQPREPDEFMTRQEVADLLKCDISTIHNWTVKGKLKPYGIGNRVYFKRSEVVKSIIPLK
jgi:excisionase family DNA binding protein